MKPVDAMEVHIQWFKDLQARLEKGEEIDPDEIGSTYRCEVGKWLHGEGTPYKDLPEFTAFLDLHARCHACAEKAVLQGKEGDRDGALRSFGSDCDQASQDMFKAWLDFYYAWKRDGSG